MDGRDGGEDECRSANVEEETVVPRSVRKRKTTDDEDFDLQQDGDMVQSACVIEGSKHADGSIYRQDTHFCHRLYRLNDTRETLCKPTNMSHPDTTNCKPNCTQHHGCAMMQIFSLKLVNHSAANNNNAPILVYGFMAVRDLLQPLRNYVFNRSRDNPLVLHPSPDDPSSPLLIQMSGPKRGIYLQARALIEYNLRIIKEPGAAAAEDDDDLLPLIKTEAAAEDDDLPLIDGAATFSELTAFHGVYTQRIHGDGHGAAVDISLALLRQAVEARIHIGITKIPAGGLSLSLACSLSGIREEIQLFDRVMYRAGNLGKSFAVAVVVGTPLTLHFKVAPAGGGTIISCCRGYSARVHGHDTDSIPLDFGTIEVRVSWANID